MSPAHWCVQAVTFDSTLIVNVYLPTDPGTINYNDQELVETLEVVQTVLDDNHTAKVIITGDFNADFGRNSGYVNDVKTFVENLDLKLSWSRFHVDFTHVTVRDDVGGRSAWRRYWQGDPVGAYLMKILLCPSFA